jgi:4-hydroxy-3-methylbut-2-enyl diphosphate reductase
MVEQLLLAKPRGFCAGVVMAIQAVERAARERPVTVYHAIVHNHSVVQRLQTDLDVIFTEELSGLRELPKGDTLVFSAHGVSPAVRAQADALGAWVIDATCPLVTKVHSEVRKYAKEGYQILLIGDSLDHQEIVGTRGEAPEAVTVVSVTGRSKPGLADPESVQVKDPQRVVVLSQTTLSVDETRATIALLRRRFPALITPSSEDLCYATKNRQDAVREVATKADAMLILTSSHSSNGMRLLELAESLCPRSYRLETAADLSALDLRGVRRLGLSSAASTPEELVAEVVAYFRARNPELEVIEEGEWEKIAFREPQRKPPAQRPGPASK